LLCRILRGIFGCILLLCAAAVDEHSAKSES